ncbi:hypothetical protein MBCUT_09470 [Methanobrevibacter cuticularis]|uniref:Class III signal peptide n=1 Tax=Methanobrevibacter cuticularis TaxID=47311 RepID=A0A166E4F2_9EURY|nr:class III signal peptide-containing protein [Methanobrevibacter cuticularis]KZX16269.1 hypothetical protein MBCUT_09470 [Methanobrevibacter cuticularis]
MNLSDIKLLNILSIDEKGQAGAEMLLLMGGMVIIVLIASYFYKDYLLNLGDEMKFTELTELNKSVNNISSKFV